MTVLILTALLPLLVVGWLGYRSADQIGRIAARSNQEVADLAMSDSEAALVRELKSHVRALGAHHAANVNAILAQVQADTLKIVDFVSYLAEHPETVNRYAYPTEYAADSELGVYGSLQPSETSWLAVTGAEDSVDEHGEISDAARELIRVGEYLDILFKSIARTNPYAVQMYFNSAIHVSRGMRFIDGEYEWVDAARMFAPAPLERDYPFYFLADAKHNPDRGPEWTELYWDPAGAGWMVTSIAPVYQGDTLIGVPGIDVTLDQIIEGIMDIRIEQTGFAFLMSETGQAIAFPDRGAEFLGYQGAWKGDFKPSEDFSHRLTNVRDPAFQTIIAAMLDGEQGLTTYRDTAQGRNFFVAYYPVPITGWSLGIVVREKEVIAPALFTNQRIQEAGALTASALEARATGLLHTFLWLLGAIALILIPVALLLARGITQPIRSLAIGTRRIGAGELDYRINLSCGDEIEDLGLTINQMASDLRAKIDQIEAANRELLELDKLKSKFISMASHELRTPLIAIQGYVDLIHDGQAGAISSEQRSMLATVSRNAKRLGRIVVQLLDVSRIEENKLVLERAPLDLRDIVRDVVDEQRPNLDSRGQELRLELAEDLTPVDGDADRLSQVVINLLGNAIKYTPDGGRISIRVALEQDEIHLAIRDSGIGIKEEDIGKLFKRFSTLGDITKHRTGSLEFLAGGAGLGLSITQGIVEAHQGRIWVESLYGHGSTFHVMLPPSVEQPASHPAPEAGTLAPDTQWMPKQGDEGQAGLIRFDQAQPDRRRTAAAASADETPFSVLVADDEPDAISLIQHMLKSRYQVFEAQSGAKAIQEAIRRKPNLVMLDAWMPGISGYDVCLTLKRNINTQDVPIIIFTAATEQIDQDRAREAGADGFVNKPLQRDQLIELIEAFRAER